MAALVIAAAGSALGGAVLGTGVVALGLTGNAIGYLAGSLLASAFAPTQKSQGPRLSDLQVGSSAYGTPIPFALGTPRIAGQIAWASAKREIATTTSQGKGGGGSEYTSFTYEVDVLIVLTDNVMDGLARVWSDGKLAANYNANADADTILATINPHLWSRMTFYTGAADQLPDPDYEAAVGTANAPAYRGRSSVFIKGLQLGGGGNLPNLTFEVVSQSVPVFVAWNAIDVYGPAGFVFTDLGKTAIPSAAGSTPRVRALLGHATGKWYFEIYANGSPSAAQNWFGVVDVTTPITGLPSLSFSSGVFAYYRGNGQRGSSALGFDGASLGALPDNAVVGFTIDLDLATVQMKMYVNNVLRWTHNFGSGEHAEMYPAIAFESASYAHTLRTEPAELGYTPPSGFKAWGDTSSELVDVGTVTLQAAVDALLARTGISSALVDTSALAAITTPVNALAVGQVASARSVLDMLASVYYFTATLSDKIYFYPRGAAPAATLAYADIGWAAGGGEVPESLAIRAGNELEIPAQMALTYSNLDGDYQTDTQYSDRLLTGQDSTSATQVPLAFTAQQAKQIVDAMVMDGYVRSFSTQITVGNEFSQLEPGKVVLATGEDGSQYRLFLEKMRLADGVRTFDCVLDDASVLSQAGTTVGGTASQTVVYALATTTLRPLDIPILRDADDLPGHYVAIKGDAAHWSNAGLYNSLDGNTYNLATTVADETVIGSCSTVLPNFTGGNVFDEASSLTVSVGLGQLVSATRTELLNDPAVNAAAVGSPAGGFELIQYRDAALVSAGIYTLTGLLRGRRGTERAMGGHAASEQFVGLGLSGLRFMQLQTADLGKLRYYKAASAGQKLADVAAQTITPMGVGLECFSPVDARANRDTTDTVLTWRRRTRLSSRITGPLTWSAPLGEASESYEVEVWDSTYTTLKRTLTASAQTVTYTSANQVTDFGSNQSVLYLRIYQLSATVGRGYALQTSI